jgi:uncharacterized protein YhaN
VGSCQYEEKAKVLTTVKSLYEEARKNTLIKMAESLGTRIEEYVKELTDGRYKKVEVSPDGLSIQVYSDEKGDFVDIDKELSTGTRDQIYLAARLAMIPTAANGRKPPLILDDSLVYFDSNRRYRAFDVVTSSPQ